MRETLRFAPLAWLLLAAALPALNAQSPGEEANPPAPGFDLAGSDPRAVELADRVMARLGGRRAWDETRYLRWTFFGKRQHVWDKQTGTIRVEGTGSDDGEPYVILMSLHDRSGRAWRAGREVTDPDELAALLDHGEASWINDSYWLFMPYKLKDTGVTLRHLGEGELADGRGAEILELTFREVGRTPENRYRVYVSRKSGLVEQWDFYPRADDEEPRFQVPWRNWQRYGRILLSDDRGERRHSDLAVYDRLPESVFTSPEAVDWGALTTAESR